jgi:hypothetical protein
MGSVHVAHREREPDRFLTDAFLPGRRVLVVRKRRAAPLRAAFLRWQENMQLLDRMRAHRHALPEPPTQPEPSELATATQTPPTQTQTQPRTGSRPRP